VRVKREWWTKLHPLTRVALFLGACLQAALASDVTATLLLAAGLLLIVVACGVLKSHLRLLVWAHLAGAPGLVLLFVAAGFERTHSWPGAWSWGLAEAGRYALRVECLFFANLALIGTTGVRELAGLAASRWVPAPAAIILSTALRFIPHTLAEARRIYEIQRCRGLRLRPWRPRSWLPLIVPLFVGQMWRAQETTLMLAVRRIVPGNGFAPGRRLRAMDWVVMGALAGGGAAGLLCRIQ
jgi:energy-coupling factor transporter transmembrane protein EcfT